MNGLSEVINNSESLLYPSFKVRFTVLTFSFNLLGKFSLAFLTFSNNSTGSLPVISLPYLGL
jgi:hypothetical protein